MRDDIRTFGIDWFFLNLVVQTSSIGLRCVAHYASLKLNNFEVKSKTMFIHHFYDNNTFQYRFFRMLSTSNCSTIKRKSSPNNAEISVAKTNHNFLWIFRVHVSTSIESQLIHKVRLRVEAFVYLHVQNGPTLMRVPSICILNAACALVWTFFDVLGSVVCSPEVFTCVTLLYQFNSIADIRLTGVAINGIGNL